MIGIAVTFLLGIANFAMHRAVIESAHPLLREMPWSRTARGRRLALALEFAILLAAMLLSASGWPELVWAYLAYTLLNCIAAWLILTDRL